MDEKRKCSGTTRPTHHVASGRLVPCAAVRAVRDDWWLIVAGLYINSYPLTLIGNAELFEMGGAGARYTRDELRDLAGVSVWVGQSDAFAYEQPAPEAPRSRVIVKPLVPPDAVLLWAVREAIVAHCVAIGYDASFGRRGEVHVIGPIEPSVEDRFRIEHVIVVRVSREDYVDADALLTVRHRARWLCADSLAERDVSRWAVGRRAIRLTGDGPRGGIVREVSGSRVVLEHGCTEIEVPAAEYTISVNSSVIASWRGSAVLRRVRVTTGDLTHGGQRNRHGVEDRFKLIGDAVRRLGSVVSVTGGGQVEIAELPVAVRLEPVP